MDVDSHPHGKPSWADLGTPDLDASRAFYGALFGWDTESDHRPESGGYTMCTIRGRPVAALYNRGEHQPDPPRWTVYVTVDHVDSTVARVGHAGGRVVDDPFDVFDAGRMARIEDPNGAPLALWQAGASIGSGIIDEPGALVWVQLDDATDAGKTFSFYRSLLGWEPDDQAYVSFHMNGRPIAGMAEPSAGGAGSWTVYFGTENRDDAATAIEKLGGRVAYVSDAPRFVYAVDPTGVPFAVIEPLT